MVPQKLNRRFSVASRIRSPARRVPAGFLGSLPTIMPSVAGVDLEGMLKDVLPLGNVRGAGERKGGGEKKRLIDVHEGSQRIEVFLE